MDIEKLKPQVFAMGQIYKMITIVCPQAEKITNPEMRPFRTYTLAIQRLHQNRKSSAAIERALAELSTQINVDDWSDIFNEVVPGELKMAFFQGYYKGTEISRLAEMRKQMNISQKQLAEAVGVTQKDISRWERGDVKPNIKNLKKLANALGCTVDDIIN